MTASSAPASDNQEESKKPSAVTPSLFRSVSLVAIITIVSKILGLVRDQMIAHAYGASMVSDAYLYAFQIPSFSLVLLGGLGGPFHTATVSVLSKILKEHEAPSEKAQQLTNTFITATGGVFAILSLLAFCFAPQVIEIIATHASPQLKLFAVQDLRWMSPMIFIGGIIGIFYGVANIYHRFLWPSLSPSAINITLILWLMILKPDTAGLALAISTLLGGLLQLAMQLPDYFKTGFRLFPAFQFKDPDFRTMGELLFPATVGTTIGQLNIYVAMFFVSQLEPGGWTATMLGNRLIQLPIGVLTIAMLVPLFPRFSRWVGEKDFESLKTNFRDGILSLWLISFPIIVLIMLVGHASVALLFQRGAFTGHDTNRVSSVLVVLSLSIVPYMLRDGITRVFYAFNDSRTPLLAGLFSILVNAFFNAILVGPYGIAGIAFSTVIVTVCNAGILSFLVRRHIQDLGLRSFITPSLKMFFASALSGGLGYAALLGLHALCQARGLHNMNLQALIEILGVLVTVSLSYFCFLLLFRVSLAYRFLQRLKLVGQKD
jgi:putative peptidoglycan lipid II flippase